MKATHLALLGAPALLLLAACGDDTTAAGSGGSGGGSATTTGATTTGAGTTTAATTTGASTSSTGEGGGATSTTSTGTGGAGTGGGSGTGGGASFDCEGVPAGPFEPTPFSSAFGGSEDIAFDGLGHLAGKSGGGMLLVDADGAETVLSPSVPSAYGIRYRSDGALIVALPSQGRVIAIDAGGATTELASGLNGPNGIHVDGNDAVWVTEFSAGAISLIDGDTVQTILGPGEAPTANGIYLDEGRGVLFYTDYSAGELWRVDPAGLEVPVLVSHIGGAALDGLTMDVCGSIYVVDQGNAVVYRVKTDAVGDALGAAEVIAELPSNVANAQFGRGEGFSPTSLYAGGNPGNVFQIEIGVPGAPQAGP